MKLRVKIDNQTFEVEIADLQARPVIAVVDGESFEVWPEEMQASLPAPVAAAPVAAPIAPAAPAAPKPAAAPAAVDASKAVTAPIPGVIVAIAVKPGDKVKVGQELCTLEAMKMKNAIRAQREGTIGTVFIAVGDQIRHGQALLEYSD